PQELQAAVVVAEQLGLQLYRYDQAAWHGSDSFQDDFKGHDTAIMRGYVVLPGEGDLLDAVFFGEVGGKLVEVARYHVRGSSVVGGGMLPENARPELPTLGVQ